MDALEYTKQRLIMIRSNIRYERDKHRYSVTNSDCENEMFTTYNAAINIIDEELASVQKEIDANEQNDSTEEHCIDLSCMDPLQ